MHQRTKIIGLIVVILLIVGVNVTLVVRNEQRKRISRAPVRSLTNTTVNDSIPPELVKLPDEPQIAKLAPSPTAVIETNYGTMEVRFYSAEAPELSKNFIELAKTGYYDGLTFHRIIQNFVIQGGDPAGDGTGGHSYKGENVGLDDEPGALALRHLRGAIAWAKTDEPFSIGSQFYIALQPLTDLDGRYSVFGQVVSGLDVVQKIGRVQTARERPVQPVRIERVTIKE